MNFQTSHRLDEYFERFARDRKPIVLQFRDVAPELAGGERATHFLHPYPAKLIRHIPYIFLAASSISRPGDVVLDPFCGSGTVMLEALISGRNAIGADANPLARLMARVKTTPIDIRAVRSRSKLLLKRVAEARTQRPCPDVVNIDHWFHKHVQRQLANLLGVITREKDTTLRDFFRVALSATLKHVSLADPRLSVPVRLRPNQYEQRHWLRAKTEERLRRLKRINVLNVFSSVLDANIRRADDFNRLLCDGVAADVVSCDARDLRRSGCRRAIGDQEIDLIITSPPYPGAQKYVRASSLALGWLGLVPVSDLRSLEAENIGREHYRQHEYDSPQATGVAAADDLIERIRGRDPLRAHIAENYLCEMRSAISEMWRVLKPGGHVVLVAGTNRIAKHVFDTQDYLTELLSQAGFRIDLRLIDDIRSRGLMTKRNRTASVISQEWVTVARKPLNV